MELGELPDELLVLIFDLLDYDESQPPEQARFHGNDGEAFRAVPRVCRRWRRLSWHPRLLERLRIEWEFWDGARLLANLRSLCCWTACAAGRVRALALEIAAELPAEERAEAAALLSSIVSACGRGGLRSLRLWISSIVTLSSWLGVACDLRWLQLLDGSDNEADNSCDLASVLHGLSQLEHLALHDVAVGARDRPTPALPTSLTSLCLFAVGDYIPAQVDCERLTLLQDLRLCECDATAEAYEPLASLPALERLSLASCLELPDCLGRLPALRLLSIHRSPHIRDHNPGIEDEGELNSIRAARLDAALGQLSATQLTQMQLAKQAAQWPPALACLRGLQVLVLLRHGHAEQLPPGPWLSSLRWAVLTTEAAATALPALATATQLEGLAMRSDTSLVQLWPVLLDILAWAPQQPALRLLEIETCDPFGRGTIASSSDPAICMAIVRAQEAAPGLQVLFGRRLRQRLLFNYDSPSITLSA